MVFSQRDLRIREHSQKVPVCTSQDLGNVMVVWKQLWSSNSFRIFDFKHWKVKGPFDPHCYPGEGGPTLFMSQFLKYLSAQGTIFLKFLSTHGPTFKFLSILGHRFFFQFLHSRATKMRFCVRSRISKISVYSGENSRKMLFFNEIWKLVSVKSVLTIYEFS